MKNVQIGQHEAADLRKQVDKVLRGLGNPEPPLELGDVRELLRLDRQFFRPLPQNLWVNLIES